MEFDEIIKEQMDSCINTEDTDILSNYASNLSKGISDEFDLDNILNSMLKGESIFDSKNIISSMKDLFLLEINSALTLGVEILGVCLVIGLLKNLSNSFGEKKVSNMASISCVIVIAGLSIKNFNVAYNLVNETLSTNAYTMEILLPILIGILISMGAVTSGTIMSPLLLTAITIFTTVLQKIILPCLFTSTILTLLNCLTEKDYVNKLSKFMRNASLFICGVIITLMTGIVAIQGLIAKASDNLIVGTAKYSLDAFIPIVGGFASDTIELFIKCMSSIKSVIGIFGVLIIITIQIIPLIKIIAISIIYKVIALLIEPITSKKLSDGINEMGTNLISMAAILFFSSLLFIIFITSILSLGGE